MFLRILITRSDERVGGQPLHNAHRFRDVPSATMYARRSVVGLLIGLLAVAGSPRSTDAAQEPSELSEPTEEGRAQFEAPTVSPNQPLPGESISIRGRAGLIRRSVLLERRVSNGWRQLGRRSTSSSGHYQFSIIAPQSAVTYRIVAPVSGGRPRAVSEVRRVQLATGAFWWELNDRCRGNTPPDEAACRLRDELTRRAGRIVIGGLHRAWRGQNFSRVLALLTDRVYLQSYRNVRPATRFRDCSYNPDEPWWFCYVRGASGVWYGTRFVVVSSVPHRLPVWRAGFLAPDV